MKTCTNCYWLSNNICENTNWKDGKPITNPLKPDCVLLGWTAIKVTK